MGFQNGLKSFLKEYFFDRDTRQSGPTIYFVGLPSLVKNLLRLDQIASNWILWDCIGLYRII